MNSIIQEADQQFVSVYNRYPIILDHGEGMYLYDVDGIHMQKAFYEDWAIDMNTEVTENE